MRVLSAVVVFVVVSGYSVAVAQAPAFGKPEGNLAQVMRGILFPNSNILFDAQTTDPGAPPPKTEGAGATAKFSNIYSGWQAVENAAIALAESGTLIMMPGRMCENGRPVPLDRPDWTKYSQGLVEAGRAALAAARAKNQEKLIEVTDQVAESCALCHEVYRDKPDVKDRCIP
jgi:hypothetical protein